MRRPLLAKNFPQRQVVLSFCFIFLSAPYFALASEITVSSSTAEWKYPPIRLEVAEAAFTAQEKSAQDELLRGSQVFEGRLHSYGMTYDDPRLIQKLESLLSIEDFGSKAFKTEIFSDKK